MHIHKHALSLCFFFKMHVFASVFSSILIYSGPMEQVVFHDSIYAYEIHSVESVITHETHPESLICLTNKETSKRPVSIQSAWQLRSERGFARRRRRHQIESHRYRICVRVRVYSTVIHERERAMHEYFP